MKVVKYVLGVLVAAVLVFGVLLWVLSAANVGNFGEWFRPYPHVVYILCTGFAVISFLYMIPTRKRMFGWLAVLLFIPAIIIAFVDQPDGYDLGWRLGVPLIILLIAGMFLFFRLFGIKKWDAGDNQKAGYKTYAQRKAEKEAEEKKALENLEKSKQKAKQAAIAKAAAEAAAKAELEFDEKHKND